MLGKHGRRFIVRTRHPILFFLVDTLVSATRSPHFLLLLLLCPIIMTFPWWLSFSTDYFRYVSLISDLIANVLGNLKLGIQESGYPTWATELSFLFYTLEHYMWSCFPFFTRKGC